MNSLNLIFNLMEFPSLCLVGVVEARVETGTSESLLSPESGTLDDMLA